MNIKLVGLLAAVNLALSGVAFAGAKNYQVTGPVVEVNDSMVVVMKGKDRWELDKNSDTKMSGGDLKVGDKVTIDYTMTAKNVEVKAAKAGKGEKKEMKAAASATPKS